MTTRWARFARGWVAALVSTFVAASSHALAGGSLPDVAGIALCLAFSGVVCIMLSGKTLSVFRLSLAVAISQFMFHGLFSLLSSPAAATTGSSVGMYPDQMTGDHMPDGHLHDSGLVSQLTAVPQANIPMSTTADLWMWLGHATGAALTIVALRYGERSLWSLLEVATLVITRLLSPRLRTALELRPLPHAVAADRAMLPRLVAVFLSALQHRGPPAVLTLLSSSQYPVLCTQFP